MWRPAWANMAIFLSFDHVDPQGTFWSFHIWWKLYSWHLVILLQNHMPWIWQYEIRSLSASLGCGGTIWNLYTEIVLINVESTFWGIVYVQELHTTTNFKNRFTFWNLCGPMPISSNSTVIRFEVGVHCTPKCSVNRVYIGIAKSISEKDHILPLVWVTLWLIFESSLGLWETMPLVRLVYLASSCASMKLVYTCETHCNLWSFRCVDSGSSDWVQKCGDPCRYL